MAIPEQSGTEDMETSRTWHGLAAEMLGCRANSFKAALYLGYPVAPHHRDAILLTSFPPCAYDLRMEYVCLEDGEVWNRKPPHPCLQY